MEVQQSITKTCALITHVHVLNLHTDIPSESNVGATVRLAHYSHHCNARCSSHRFGLQFRQQDSSVGMRHSCNDVHQAWLSWQAILAGNLALQSDNSK